MQATLGRLAKIVFFLTVLVATSLSTFVPAALAATDDDVYDDYDAFDTFEQFEQMDAAEFDGLIEQAKECITDWDFACARDKLAKAKQYITKKEDNETIAALERLISFEALLAKSSECAKSWNFDCAVDKLKEAKSYAEANLDSLYVEVPVLEDRLRAIADYVEEQYNRWEEAARRNPDIILTGSYEDSDGQVVSAEVWAAGKRVFSANVLIEWYNPSISGYDVTLYEGNGNAFVSFPSMLCTLYIFGSGYYSNELHCAGERIGKTEGYERFNYPLERLVRDVVTHYYQYKYLR